MNQAFSKIWILIILIIFIGGGFFAWQYFMAAEEAETLEKVLENEIADWQIYTNEEWGFEIKYPSNWYIDDEMDLLNFFEIFFTNGRDEGVSVQIFRESTNTEAEALLSDTWLTSAKEEEAEIEEITIDTEGGYRATAESFIDVAVIRDNYVYKFTTPYPQKTPFNQMLSTFRFLE